MDINVLLIIVILILLSGAAWGWRRGIIESVIGIISCALGLLVIITVANGVGSFMQKSYVRLTMAVALLLAISIIHKIIIFLAEALKLIRHVPAGKLVDKLTGAVLGLAEAVFVIWLLFLLSGFLEIMGLNAWIMAQVEKSRFLTVLYYSNYLVELLRGIVV